MEATILVKDNPQKEQIKVTDKRIFTADGDIREEFRGEIKPSEPGQRSQPPAPDKPAQGPTAADPGQQRPAENPATEGERRRKMGDRSANPGTPFTNFIEPLIAQGYMNLGMLPNPYSPQQSKPDAGAARQMIDILNLLQEKTAGNLTPDEEDFLSIYLGELKLAFVKITKSI